MILNAVCHWFANRYIRYWLDKQYYNMYQNVLELFLHLVKCFLQVTDDLEGVVGSVSNYRGFDSRRSVHEQECLL